MPGSNFKTATYFSEILRSKLATGVALPVASIVCVQPAINNAPKAVINKMKDFAIINEQFFLGILILNHAI
ncbi:MAG: hypothetical protein CBE16_13575 [Rhodospirillaceae bacterium TMED256]|nr:MAG: hypothetical protein CBE16_13575 [Rhodospirillaceae bacterium TMED256]